MIKKKLKKLEENRSKQILFFVVSMLLMTMIYVPLMYVFLEKNETKAIQKQIEIKDRSILTNIEGIVQKDGKLILNGWCLDIGSKNTNIHVLLQDSTGVEYKVVKAQMVQREDVSNYFIGGIEYVDCGFMVGVKEKELKKDIAYEIILHYTSSDIMDTGKEEIKKVSTGKYLLNGNLYSYNPNDFAEPEISDIQIQNVIQNGKLLLFDKEKQLWIYKFESQLFYIVNTDISIAEETNIGVPVMVYTSLPDKLPFERKEYGFDHLGFYFADNKYQVEGIIPYQIFAVNCDVDYPVTYITTGLYDATNSVWVDGNYMVYMGDSFFED